MSKIIVRRQEYANNGTHANEIEAVVQQNLIANTLSSATDIAASVGLVKSETDAIKESLSYMDTDFVLSSVLAGSVTLQRCLRRTVTIAGTTPVLTTTPVTLATLKPLYRQAVYIPAGITPASSGDLNKVFVFLDTDGNLMAQAVSNTSYGVYYSLTYCI